MRKKNCSTAEAEPPLNSFVILRVRCGYKIKLQPPRSRSHTKESMPDKPQTPDENLQQEFNRWAAAGEGPKMEQHHLDITEKTIRLMNLRPGERVLDLG